MRHAVQNIYLFILPGLLMAMTGVGVGDLATAGFTGAQLGTTVLWAVVLGGLFKFLLTEGIARWQLGSGQTIIQGCIERFPIAFFIFLLVYFIPWCWFVGGALINASGVAGKELGALLDIEINKSTSGIIHSLAILALLLLGKQVIFNRLMSALAVVLFVTVIFCVFFVPVSLGDVLTGLLIPQIPNQPDALTWTLALMGGVGGTLTILCYGYWLADSDRSGKAGLITSRWDIAISYTMTCLFGIAMVIIGSAAVQEGKGLSLLLSISQYFSSNVHPAVGMAFLFGAWAAIVSSLLGVWQAVPLIFADSFYNLKHTPRSLKALPQSNAYRIWLGLLAIVPMLSLFMSFKEIQKLYSFVGAFFMPVLALCLLWLNNRYITPTFKNSLAINVSLILVLIFFTGSSLLKWFG